VEHSLQPKAASCSMLPKIKISTNTIQSYFYFRYINANDNLLFIIHQYHFLSFSHH